MKCKINKSIFWLCTFRKKKLCFWICLPQFKWDSSDLESKDALEHVCLVLNLDRKSRCLFGPRRPERGAHQQSGGAVPDRNVGWRPWTFFMESSCESAAASFLPLVNEISHAALLQAPGALFGSAFYAFKHFIGICQFLTYFFGHKHAINWNI